MLISAKDITEIQEFRTRFTRFDEFKHKDYLSFMRDLFPAVYLEARSLFAPERYDSGCAQSFRGGRITSIRLIPPRRVIEITLSSRSLTKAYRFLCHEPDIVTLPFQADALSELDFPFVYESLAFKRPMIVFYMLNSEFSAIEFEKLEILECDFDSSSDVNERLAWDGSPDHPVLDLTKGWVVSRVTEPEDFS